MKKFLNYIRNITSNKIVKRIWKYTSDMIVILLVVLVALSVYGNIKTKGKAFNASSVGSYTWMSVLSDSMKPVFSAGDLIVARKIEAKDLKVGDIVTYRWGVSLSTHRIAEIIKDDKGSLSFKTKGDNNNAADEEPIVSSSIIGRYMFKIPFIGYILTKLKGLTGVVLIWLMFAVVVSSEVFGYMKKTNRKSTEESVVED